MKIAVYTIALNEAAHADRWANSAIDADYRIVVDTGSTDDTVERLRNAGVTVHRIAVRPWRFDVARNAAIAMIPADVDICCSMDMDRYLEPGWRAKLEAAWTPGTTALFCRTVYRTRPDDPTILREWPTKNFHHRRGYRFNRPVHEALSYAGQEVTQGCLDIVMCEVQDHSKQTRQQYLPLMELAHKENPDDAQICFWLGRDYMWMNKNDEASALFHQYLALPTSTWTEERSEAMRFLARTEPDKKRHWLDKARTEAPHRREVWLDLAEQYHRDRDWLNLFWASSNGIERTRRTGSYLDDLQCWDFRLYDLGATAAWHVGVIDRAVDWAKRAYESEPAKPRLKDNFDFFSRQAASWRSIRNNVPADARTDARAAEEYWSTKLSDSRHLRDLEDFDHFIQAAEQTFRIRPHRAEPLHDISNFLLGKGRAELAASYAEAALSIAYPKGDTIGVDEGFYKIGLPHAFSVAANWSRDSEQKERGRKVCDWLALSRDTPENVRKTARYNSGWYTKPLQSILPSICFHQLSIKAPDGFRGANVGICRRGSQFALTIRSVNYNLSGGFHVKGDDPSYRSRMLLASMSPDFQVSDPVEVKLPDDLPALSTEALGFEDPRPLIWSGSLWCVSSVRQLNAEARPEMVLARIDETDIQRPELRDWRVLRSGVAPRWEKNWMPMVSTDPGLQIRLIYSLDPTRIITLGGDELLNEPAGIAADTFFGGSQAVPYESGWLTVIHEFEWVDQKRRYFHRFVWLDDNGHLQRFSRRFYLRSPGYEFVAGMTWDHQDKNLLVTFSMNDRDLYVAVVQPSELSAILLTIAEHREASEEVVRGGEKFVKMILDQELK